MEDLTSTVSNPVKNIASNQRQKMLFLQGKQGVGLGRIFTTEKSPNSFHQCGGREVDAGEGFSHLGHEHCCLDTALRKRCTRCGTEIRAGLHSTRAGTQIQMWS